MDWSDFNLHLKPRQQQCMLKCMAKRVMRDLARKEDRDLLSKIVARESRALLNQVMIVKYKRHRIQQGECSGIRLTDTFNSLANMTMTEMVFRLWSDCGFDVESSILKWINKPSRERGNISHLGVGICEFLGG